MYRQLSDGSFVLDEDTLTTSGTIRVDGKRAFCLDASSGNQTQTLPALSNTMKGWECEFTKIDSTANTATLATSGGNTINGASTYVLSTQYQTVRVKATQMVGGALQFTVRIKA